MVATGRVPGDGNSGWAACLVVDLSSGSECRAHVEGPGVRVPIAGKAGSAASVGAAVFAAAVFVEAAAVYRAAVCRVVGR